MHGFRLDVPFLVFGWDASEEDQEYYVLRWQESKQRHKVMLVRNDCEGLKESIRGLQTELNRARSRHMSRTMSQPTRVRLPRATGGGNKDGAAHR